MTILVDDKSIEIYETGVLDYAISCLQEQGSFDKYAEWLKTQPVASFTNTEGWTLDKKEQEIVYTEDEVDDGTYEERYPITAIIGIGDEELIHSTRAMSFFFRVEDDLSLTALYVD